jgi:hypothetical protein
MATLRTAARDRLATRGGGIAAAAAATAKQRERLSALSAGEHHCTGHQHSGQENPTFHGEGS